MTQRILAIVVLFFATLARADEPMRITCVGDSITFGAGIKDRATMSYPAQLQAMLGKSAVVTNCGMSGATLLAKGNLPYIKQRIYTMAMSSSPDIVLIMLGTNDTKPVNWDAHKEDFESDYKNLINEFRQLPTHPRVILILPVPVMSDAMTIRKGMMDKEVVPAVRKIAFDESCEIIDLHTALIGAQSMVPDQIHPNADGAKLMASRVARTLSMKSDSEFDIEKNLKEQSPTKSSFYGYESLNFKWNGRACRVVKPKRVAAGHPYIWRMAFFGHEPQADLGLLEAGWHVVEVNVDNMLGGPDAVKICSDFQAFLTKAGLNPKAVLEGMSRGGLYTINYAHAHPDQVMAIYNDNPVLDLKSWPGGKGKGKGSAQDWTLAQKVYGLSEEQLMNFKGNPVDFAADLAKSKIPILTICGTADTVVPVDENIRPFAKAYKDAGGPIEVIEKPGLDHHPHSLVDPEPIVTFMLKAASDTK